MYQANFIPFQAPNHVHPKDVTSGPFCKKPYKQTPSSCKIHKRSPRLATEPGFRKGLDFPKIGRNMLRLRSHFFSRIFGLGLPRKIDTCLKNNRQNQNELLPCMQLLKVCHSAAFANGHRIDFLVPFIQKPGDEVATSLQRWTVRLGVQCLTRCSVLGDCGLAWTAQNATGNPRWRNPSCFVTGWWLMDFWWFLALFSLFKTGSKDIRTDKGPPAAASEMPGWKRRTNTLEQTCAIPLPKHNESSKSWKSLSQSWSFKNQNKIK